MARTTRRAVAFWTPIASASRTINAYLLPDPIWSPARPATAIAADYDLSGERGRARCAARGEPDQGPQLAAFLAERGTTAAEVIRRTLAELDVEGCLREGGLKDQDVAALRRRLVGP